MVGQEKPIDKQGRGKEQVVASIVQGFEKMMMEGKKKLAVNATAGVKSKTEGIQIIVKAAVRQLGMSGVRWEE